MFPEHWGVERDRSFLRREACVVMLLPSFTFVLSAPAGSRRNLEGGASGAGNIGVKQTGTDTTQGFVFFCLVYACIALLQRDCISRRTNLVWNWFNSSGACCEKSIIKAITLEWKLVVVMPRWYRFKCFFLLGGSNDQKVDVGKQPAFQKWEYDSWCICTNLRVHPASMVAAIPNPNIIKL